MLEAREFEPEENNSIVVHVTVPFENGKRTISQTYGFENSSGDRRIRTQRGLIAPCAYLLWISAVFYQDLELDICICICKCIFFTRRLFVSFCSFSSGDTPNRTTGMKRPTKQDDQEPYIHRLTPEQIERHCRRQPRLCSSWHAISSLCM